MQRLLLRAFVVLVVGNAVLGSAVLLAGGLDGTGGKVFATSLLATAAMLVAIACSTGLRTRRGRPVSYGGMAAAAAGFSLAAAGIWTETDAAWLRQLVGTLILLAIAAAGISLLSLATLPPQQRWLHVLDFLLTSLLTAALLVVIWYDEAATDWYLRITGVVGVAVAACTLVLPALHRAWARELRQAAAARVPVSFCPACGVAPVQPDACNACGARFSVSFTSAGTA